MFIEELETRLAPMCILPEHGNRPCNDVIVRPFPGPNAAAYENASPNAAFSDSVITTLAIGEEVGY